MSTTENHNQQSSDLTTFVAQVETNGSNFYFPLVRCGRRAGREEGREGGRGGLGRIEGGGGD